MNVVDAVLVCGLAVLAYVDIKHKMIPVAPVVLISAVLLLYGWLGGQSIVSLAAGIVPGGMLLLLAYCTGESIGAGDGIVFCMIGAGCGFARTVTILGGALLLAAIVAVVLLIIKKAERKTELPFLPSVFFSFLLELIW